jgi:hypothetical protein
MDDEEWRLDISWDASFRCSLPGKEECLPVIVVRSLYTTVHEAQVMTQFLQEGQKRESVRVALAVSLLYTVTRSEILTWTCMPILEIYESWKQEMLPPT